MLCRENYPSHTKMLCSIISHCSNSTVGISTLNFDVSLISPVGAPRVFDNPIITKCGVSSIPYYNHCVIAGIPVISAKREPHVGVILFELIIWKLTWCICQTLLIYKIQKNRPLHIHLSKQLLWKQPVSSV